MFWCFKTINALHGKEVSQTHLEKRNTMFAKFLILSIDIEFSHFTVTHWQQRSPSRLSGVSDPTPSRWQALCVPYFVGSRDEKAVLKGFVVSAWLLFCCFFLLISRKISRLCILFLHQQDAAMVVLESWLRYCSLGTPHLLRIAGGTVRSAAMNTFPFEGCTDVQTTFSGALFSDRMC